MGLWDGAGGAVLGAVLGALVGVLVGYYLSQTYQIPNDVSLAFSTGSGVTPFLYISNFDNLSANNFDPITVCIKNVGRIPSGRTTIGVDPFLITNFFDVIRGPYEITSFNLNETPSCGALPIKFRADYHASSEEIIGRHQVTLMATCQYCNEVKVINIDACFLNATNPDPWIC